MKYEIVNIRCFLHMWIKSINFHIYNEFLNAFFNDNKERDHCRKNYTISYRYY